MELKIPPVIQLFVIAGAMWLVSRLLSSTTSAFNGIPWLATIICIAGIAIAVSGIFAFRAAHTTVDPRTPAKTTSLVTDGIYRYSRNPMYLGFLLMLFAWACLLGSGVALIFIPVFVVWMNRYQIRPEERSMHALFKQEYQDYSRSVRRWI